MISEKNEWLDASLQSIFDCLDASEQCIFDCLDASKQSIFDCSDASKQSISEWPIDPIALIGRMHPASHK